MDRREYKNLKKIFALTREVCEANSIRTYHIKKHKVRTYSLLTSIYKTLLKKARKQLTI